MRSFPTAVARTTPPARTLWLGAALVGLAAAFLWAPVGVLCVLGAASCAWLVDRRARVSVLLVVGGKTVLALFATVAASAYFADGLLPGQVDQVFYTETARSIARSILTERTLSVDYSSSVDIHNRSYNVVLGWATALGRAGGFGGASAADLLGYRMLNVLFSTLLVVVALRLTTTLYAGAPNLRTYQALTVWGVGFMPYLTIYSQMVTRDVMIALLFTTFIYGLVARKLVLAVIAVGVMYFTRLQFGIILSVAVLGWLLLSVIVRRHRNILWGGVALAALGTGGYVATFVLPSIAFVRSAVSPGQLAGFAAAFPVGILGLDVLFASQGDLALSRSTLLATRLITPETILLPIFSILGMILSKDNLYLKFSIMTYFIIVSYMLGYYISYGSVFLRLISPYYPAMLIMSLPIFMARERSRPRAALSLGACAQ